ncbi:hypothetical protein [Halorientalis salina]|uniref:hypothetical protein n=1 Tax=Halorientalis salina TaxID=2932266 RepID=UPI0010ABBEF7|nr:hypothetical protein [Halorientalis salina]
MGQWSVDVDEERNRLYAELSGFFVEEEATESTEEFIEAAERLETGFDMIQDLAELQIGDPGAAEQLERGKRRLAENGLATVVRIPPTATTSELQYEESGEDAENYEIRTASSVTEAETILDNQ